MKQKHGYLNPTSSDKDDNGTVVIGELTSLHENWKVAKKYAYNSPFKKHKCIKRK